MDRLGPTNDAGRLVCRGCCLLRRDGDDRWCHAHVFIPLAWAASRATPDGAIEHLIGRTDATPDWCPERKGATT